MKPIFIVAAAILVSAYTNNNKPDNKLLSLFNKTFPAAENIKWHEDANGYVVFFTMNGISNRICYDIKEKFLEEDRYYNEDHLPAYILLAIKKNYPEKTIAGVTEVINTSAICYQVNLKDDKNLFVIKVTSDGTIQSEKEFTNAD